MKKNKLPKKLKLSKGLIELEDMYGQYTFTNEYNVKEIWFMVDELQKTTNALISYLSTMEGKSK